jgi:hypothetical protein
MTNKLKSQFVPWFGSKADTARALGITRASFQEWPEELTQRQVNELMGAAISEGLAKFVPYSHIRKLMDASRVRQGGNNG